MSTFNHTPIVNADERKNDAAIWNDPLGQLDAAIGNVSSLGTTTKSSLVAAIGTSALSTSAKSTLIAAINSLYTEMEAGRGGQVNLDTRLDTIEINHSALSSEIAIARDGKANLDARLDIEEGVRASADNALDTRIDNLIIGSGTSSAEVVDARDSGNTDGTSVAVLSDRIAQIAANIYHPMAYAVVGDGVTDDSTQLSVLVNTTMQPAGGTIVIDRSYAIAADITFPANVTLLFANGGRFIVGSTYTTLTATEPAAETVMAVADTTGFFNSNNIAVQLDSGGWRLTTVSGTPTGSTITLASGLQSQASSGNTVGKRVRCWIRGDVIAGHYQIFELNGAGVVAFYRGGQWSHEVIGFVLPEWWGAHSNNADNAAALNACFAAARGILVKWDGRYKIQSPVSITTSYLRIQGNGIQSSSMLVLDSTFAAGTQNYMLGYDPNATGANLNGEGLPLQFLYPQVRGLQFSVEDTSGVAPYVNANLWQFRPSRDNGAGSATGALENCFFEDISFGCMHSCQIAGYLKIDYAGPIIINHINVAYGSGVNTIHDYPIHIQAHNGIAINNLNFNESGATKGVYIKASGWMHLSGTWVENMAGNGEPAITLVPRTSAVRLLLDGLHLASTNPHGGTRVGVMVDLSGIGGAANEDEYDFDLNGIYPNNWSGTDVPIRIKTKSSNIDYTINYFTQGATSPVWRGIKHFSRHRVETAGFRTINNGRAKEISQSIGQVAIGGTFEIVHDQMLTPLNLTSKAGMYLLMIVGRRNDTSAVIKEAFFVGFGGLAASIQATSFDSAGNFTLAKNGGNTAVVVTNASGLLLENVTYHCIQMTSGFNW